MHNQLVDSDPDRVTHTHVGELAALAQAVHGRGADAEQVRDLADGE